MEQVISMILAVRKSLETLVITATDHNTSIIYGSREVLQDAANILSNKLKEEKESQQLKATDDAPRGVADGR